MFTKENQGNLTIEDIMLTLLANSKSYDEFHKKSGLDNKTASVYWMSKK